MLLKQFDKLKFNNIKNSTLKFTLKLKKINYFCEFSLSVTISDLQKLRLLRFLEDYNQANDKLCQSTDRSYITVFYLFYGLSYHYAKICSLKKNVKF